MRASASVRRARVDNRTGEILEGREKEFARISSVDHLEERHSTLATWVFHDGSSLRRRAGRFVGSICSVSDVNASFVALVELVQARLSFSLLPVRIR